MQIISDPVWQLWIFYIEHNDSDAPFDNNSVAQVLPCLCGGELFWKSLSKNQKRSKVANVEVDYFYHERWRSTKLIIVDSKPCNITSVHSLRSTSNIFLLSNMNQEGLSQNCFKLHIWFIRERKNYWKYPHQQITQTGLRPIGILAKATKEFTWQNLTDWNWEITHQIGKNFHGT